MRHLVEVGHVPRLPGEERSTSEGHSGDSGNACRGRHGAQGGGRSGEVAEGNPAGLKHPVSCSGFRFTLYTVEDHFRGLSTGQRTRFSFLNNNSSDSVPDQDPSGSW